MEFDPDLALRACAQNLDLASASGRINSVRLRRPFWMYVHRRDKLGVLFGQYRELLLRGIVRWGFVIQANEVLFAPGRQDAPGEVVFATDDASAGCTVDPIGLEEVAIAIASLKGTVHADDELDAIADHLTKETVRAIGMPVPPSLSPSLHCRISTTYFVRDHLPGRQLLNPLLPLIVMPEDPLIVLPLPARFWPRELTRWWSGF